SAPRGRHMLVPGGRLRRGVVGGRRGRLRRDLSNGWAPGRRRAFALGERRARLVLLRRTGGRPNGAADGLLPHTLLSREAASATLGTCSPNTEFAFGSTTNASPVNR